MDQHMSKSTAAEWTAERIRQRVETLAPWFHNINLKGVQTAPSHFLGDYPRVKWRGFAEALPADLTGKSVLDIGCNGGFYALEMKRRGADRVLAVDFDPRYLAQARFAAEVEQLDIEFKQLSVYDVATLGERFDIVFFIGIFYHLRHPLLALDLIHDHVARDIMVFQSMQRGSKQVLPVQPDYDFWEQDMFDDPGFPKMHFIEQSYSSDPTNWWTPNRACTEAMLRSSGFNITSRPEEEVYLCTWCPRPCDGYGAVYPALPAAVKP